MCQNQLISDQPFEQFELVTDRDTYISGENIWFATHSKMADDQNNPALSKIMYVELFSANGKVIDRGKFPIQNGQANGMLTIPEEQLSGIYILRAYTQYLRNFNCRVFPMAMLQVINPNIPLSQEIANDEFEVLLHPQGGDLIYGKSSDVYFRLPVHIVPSVTNVDLIYKDSILQQEVVMYENGLGKFQITPEEENKHYLRFTLNDGDSLLVPLPMATSTGIRIQITDEKKEIVYKLINHSQSPFTRKERFHLTVSSSNFSRVYQDSISGASQVIEFHVHKDQIQSGVNYFVLKNSQDDILDISAYYHKQIDILPLKMNLSKKEYSPGDKVELQLLNNDIQEGEILNISISVAKTGTQVVNQDFLPDYLINQADLIDPTQLLAYRNQDEILDQVRITYGLYSSGILHNPILIEELTQYQRALKHLPETRNLTISGYVENSETKSGVGGTNVLLSYVGEYTQIHVNETQDDGYFVFAIDPYGAYQDLLLCTFDENPNQEILINNDYSSTYPELGKISIRIDTTDKRLLEEMLINYQLEKLSEEPGIAKANDQTAHQLGFGTPEISIRLDDYIDLPSMEVVLNEIVPYVKVRKRKGNYNMTILDSETGLTYENHLILVDNIPLDNVDELMRIHPAKVEKVEVINRTYVIGDHTYRGILMLTTYTENFGGITLPGDAVFIKYPMSSSSPEFKGISESAGNQLPKFRNVLLWNPNLIIKEEKKIQFFTSNHFSNYQIILKGTSSRGRIIHETMEFQVKE